eukprot:14883184-Alexandrium_andersonii.AAC.1
MRARQQCPCISRKPVNRAAVPPAARGGYVHCRHPSQPRSGGWQRPRPHWATAERPPGHKRALRLQ